ncbi:MAG: L,D-transpeptidase [Methylocystis sp.]|nr:L,D-transpeptidase [Methylocystis sp.]MCA3583187.1 L,D-transpeptidase [Methylocystis sp.]MCA3587608.1 L,D-transpeptidase [Methylocystis sp.]MCA3590735.1 L,D-transpeptidase [Methylocystis sp.]
MPVPPLSSTLLRAALVAGILLPAAAPPAMAAERVAFAGPFPPGEIVISQSERRLYLVEGDGTAIRYRVAVGKAGKQWTGRTRIEAKYQRVAWSPPRSVKRDRPWLPDVIEADDPANPMGARVLSLPGEYAIHGTSASMRSSIGTAASYGCIRMLNEDIIDLYERVRVGTPVTVIR